MGIQYIYGAGYFCHLFFALKWAIFNRAFQCFQNHLQASSWKLYAFLMSTTGIRSKAHGFSSTGNLHIQQALSGTFWTVSIVSSEEASWIALWIAFPNLDLLQLDFCFWGNGEIYKDLLKRHRRAENSDSKCDDCDFNVQTRASYWDFFCKVSSTNRDYCMGTWGSCLI